MNEFVKWMVEIHRELLAVDGYTAALVTVVAVLLVWHGKRLKALDLHIRFNGKAREEKSAKQSDKQPLGD
jgi:hypothetical protein